MEDPWHQKERRKKDSTLWHTLDADIGRALIARREGGSVIKHVSPVVDAPHHVLFALLVAELTLPNSQIWQRVPSSPNQSGK